MGTSVKENGQGVAKSAILATAKIRNTPAALPIMFLERIDQCRAVPSSSNCIGTALFITGEIEQDRFTDINTAYKLYLDGHLRKLDAPVVGCLVAWILDFNSFISTEHMGVITAIKNEVLVTYRKSRAGILMENRPLDVAGGRYAELMKQHDFCRQEYFLPSILQ
jgi:hypothetical protein